MLRFWKDNNSNADRIACFFISPLQTPVWTNPDKSLNSVDFPLPEEPCDLSKILYNFTITAKTRPNLILPSQLSSIGSDLPWIT